jgi:hypothetical protein
MRNNARQSQSQPGSRHNAPVFLGLPIFTELLSRITLSKLSVSFTGPTADDPYDHGHVGARLARTRPDDNSFKVPSVEHSPVLYILLTAHDVNLRIDMM